MMEDGSGIIVLDDAEEREPSEEEIREYAEFLGIDIDEEPHLLWIARKGVIAPVPPPWKACSQNGDDVFYFNFETGESLWDHPCDEQYRRMVQEYREKHDSNQGRAAAASSQQDDGDQTGTGKATDKVAIKQDGQAENKALKSLLKDRTRMLQGEEYLRVKTSSVVFREPAVSDCGSEEEERDSISVPGSDDDSTEPTHQDDLEEALQPSSTSSAQDSLSRQPKAGGLSTVISAAVAADARGRSNSGLAATIARDIAELDPPVARQVSAPAQVAGPDSPSTVDDQRRLEAIRKEISDDESLPLEATSHSGDTPKLSGFDVALSAARFAAKLSVKVQPGAKLAGSKYIGHDVRLRNRQRVVRAKERRHGKKHPEVAYALHRLADEHGRLGAIHAQRETLELALQVHEESCGRSHPGSSAIVASLADLRRSLGYHAAADELLTRFRAIRAQSAQNTEDAIQAIQVSDNSTSDDDSQTAPSVKVPKPREAADVPATAATVGMLAAGKEAAALGTPAAVIPASSCSPSAAALRLTGPLFARYSRLAQQMDSLSQTISMLQGIRAKQDVYFAIATTIT